MPIIAYQNKIKQITLYKAEDLSYLPAGWHPPYISYSLANIRKPLRNPAKKREALLNAPGIRTSACNCRVVDEATTAELDRLDNQIKKLRERKREIVAEAFLTFPLVTDKDVPLARSRVFATKVEAENRNS